MKLIKYSCVFLALFLFLSCSYAPDGNSKRPYTPVFRVFVNQDMSSLEHRCDLNSLISGGVDLRGNNKIPSISWKDAPTSDTQQVKSYHIGIFSDESNAACIKAPGSQYSCTHAVFAVNAPDADKGGLTSNSGEVLDSKRTYYTFAADSWSGSSSVPDETYIGPCIPNQEITYRVVLIASAATKLKLQTSSFSNAIFYEYFIGDGHVSPVPDILGITEVDVTYTIR